MPETLYTADEHLGHKFMARLRGFGEDVEAHDEFRVASWNGVVGKRDIVWFLGDLSFHNKEDTPIFFRRLNGIKHLVRGNHDPMHVVNLPWASVSDLTSHKHNGTRYVLCHYPLLTWANAHHGSRHLHGHCIDDSTEILTRDGWQRRGKIHIGQMVATVNPALETVWQPVLDLIDHTQNGSAVSIVSKGFDMRVTPEHDVVILHSNLKSLMKAKAIEFGDRSNKRILNAGSNTQPDYPIDDDLLRLYVWFVADGSIENSSLCRFHLRKQRKIQRIGELLTRLSIPFSENLQGAGTTKINHTLPAQLIKLGKPLHPFVMSLSQRQVLIVLEEYLHTDGNMQSQNSFQITTSKPEEADLLQTMLVTNGMRCIQHTRSNDNVVLSCNFKHYCQTTSASDLMHIENVRDEHFWCISVENANFFMRRNGKVCITGNSHGNLNPNVRTTRLDVGVDCHPNQRPFTIEEIEAAFTQLTYDFVDHHTTDKTGETR